MRVVQIFSFRSGETRDDFRATSYGSRNMPSEFYKTLRLSRPFTRILANVAALEFDLNGTPNLEAMTPRPIMRHHLERALSQGRHLIAEC